MGLFKYYGEDFHPPYAKPNPFFLLLATPQSSFKNLNAHYDKKGTMMVNSDITLILSLWIFLIPIECLHSQNKTEKSVKKQKYVVYIKFKAIIINPPTQYLNTPRYISYKFL